MNRREALKSIGVAATLSLSSKELFALGREAHAQLHASAGEDRYLFQCLDADESEILSAAAELILPETDTPGARAAKVPEFIDSLLEGWFHDDERKKFLRGLRDLDERARSSEGTGFASCANAAQTRILQEVEREALSEIETEKPSRLALRGAQSSPGAPFFSALKWLTLFGYYTSEAGMAEELEFVDFPGSYDGCALLRSR